VLITFGTSRNASEFGNHQRLDQRYDEHPESWSHAATQPSAGDASDEQQNNVGSSQHPEENLQAIAYGPKLLSLLFYFSIPSRLCVALSKVGYLAD